MTSKPRTKTVGGGPTGTFELPPPAGWRVMRQTWRELLFLHWAFDPAAIQATLPEGLTVDTFDEGSGPRAYVGVVPFLMAKVRPVGLPPVPGLSWFGELNLRTYVLGPDGSPGVWFYSLDAHQRIAVWLARTFFALPYHHAAIRCTRTSADEVSQALASAQHDPPAGRVRYDWSRDGRSGWEATADFVYDTPDAASARPAPPGTLEHFLVERYLLYSRRPLFVARPGHAAIPRGGKLFVGRVDHEPYRIAPATVHTSDTSLFSLNGLEVPGEACVSALWSPGVEVSVYPLARVSGQ